jgi:hypothetical protein
MSLPMANSQLSQSKIPPEISQRNKWKSCMAAKGDDTGVLAEGGETYLMPFLKS